MFKIIVVDVRNIIIHEEDIVDSVDAYGRYDDAIKKYAAIKDEQNPPYKVMFMETCAEIIL